MRKLIEKYPVGAVMVFAMLCLLPLMILRDFSPANELRYLSIADEALSGGHFFAFYNHGVAYADKPPLYFWLVMGGKALFGCHSMPFLALLSLLCAFGIVGVMDRWALKGADALTRAGAAVMLLSSALFLGLSVFVRMDMLMCLFITLALYAFWKDRPWLFALFTFLGLFAKGPVGLLVPLLSVVVWLALRGEGKRILRFAGWRFLLVVGGLCAVWFGLAYLEGGREYIHNLLVHQTVDRAVNAFHHKKGIWFYLLVIWGVAAPWCLLTVPSVVSGLKGCRRDDAPVLPDRALEGFFAVVSLTTFVMLSLFSSKMAVYLLPMLPFLSYGFVLCERRIGWKGWMKAGLGVAGGLFVLIGLAFMVAFFAYDALYLPSEYAFLRTGMLMIYGIMAIWAGVRCFATLRTSWKEGVITMGTVMLAVIFLLSFSLPQINRRTAYGPLCEDILRVEHMSPPVLRPSDDTGVSRDFGGSGDGAIYTVGLYRPDNIDVYIGRTAVVIDPARLAEMLPQIPVGALIVLDKKKDVLAYGRYSKLLLASGRAPYDSYPLYQIWK